MEIQDIEIFILLLILYRLVQIVLILVKCASKNITQIGDDSKPKGDENLVFPSLSFLILSFNT